MTRLLLCLLWIAGVAGCATTHKNSQDQLQSRVVELEKKLEEKDAEIVDLQYELKDLSGRIETNLPRQQPAVAVGVAPVPVAVARPTGDVIRVEASPEQVQTALKNAGIYNGKIDGKIGPGTKAAIVEFQRSQGLTADGVVGRRTWEALRQHLNQ